MWPTINPTRGIARVALAIAALATLPARAIDTDLYSVSSTATAPNVLFVLDNSASYANNSQDFPDPSDSSSTIYQGQAELEAIRKVIPQLTGSINIGLMEFVTKSNGSTNGGFIRYKIRPMGPDQGTDAAAYQANFLSLLSKMKDRLRNTNEKTDDNSQQYGMLMADAYAYFGGLSAYADSSRVVSSYTDGGETITVADSEAYSAAYTQFSSPLSSSNSCAKNYIIFIGNTKPTGPSKDDASNLTALNAAGGDTSQLKLPVFVKSSDHTDWYDLGYSSSCYASAPSGTPTDYSSQCQYVDGVYTNASAKYDTCQYNGNDSTTTAANCASGTQRYQVYQDKTTTTTTSSSTTTASTSTSNQCYASTSAWSSSSGDYGSLSCPSDSVTVSGDTTTTVSHSCSYSIGSAVSSCSGTVATSSSTTNSCYASSSAVSSSDIGSLSCPSGASCTYAVSSSPASTCSASNVVSTSTTNSCYSSSSTGTDYGSLSCPSGYTCTYATGSTTGSACSNPGASNTTTTAYYTSTPTVTASSGTVTSPATAATLSCPTGYNCTYAATNASSASIGDTSTAYTYSCYSSAPSLTSPSTSSSVATQTTLSCPANAQCTYTATAVSNSAIKDGLGKNCGASGSTGSGSLYQITQTVYSTKYTITQTPDTSTHYHYTITQTATPTATYKFTVTQTATTGTSKYAITMTDTQTTTVSKRTTTTTSLGNTSACYSSLPNCVTSDFTCADGASCYCSASNVTNLCPTGTQRYKAQGGIQSIGTDKSNPLTYTTDTKTWNADEWARFLYQKGVPISGTTDASTNQAIKASVATYTIDVYNKKPSTDQSSLLSSMATNGGGRYFSAKSQDALVSALKTIFSEILAVNSTYASAALPISATNRAQNDNQVYIPVFRPDPQALPRWYGNMKRYQLGALSSGKTDLVDSNGDQAINPSSGFVTPCARSYWTSDSSYYWGTVSGSTVSPTVFFTVADTAGKTWVTQGNELKLATDGGCTSANVYSDLPDGPFVEKGAVAEMLRKSSSRNMKTLSSSAALVDFTTANVTNLSSDSTINNNIVNFIRGQDVTGELGGTASTSMRPSIHGDVVHSRPLPIDYGGDINVRIYYGANDGTYRAVNGQTGEEDWSFVAPEFYSGLQRLLDNTPVVKSPSPTPSGKSEATGTQKSFFFDGSTGLYQNKDNSKVWIYPVMRRGGRMIYAFDVSSTKVTNKSPGFKWKFGCPNLTNDTGCGRVTASSGSTVLDTDNTDIAAIGQTWSTPNVVFLSGYSTTVPVLVVGGGYDTCEDADQAPDSSFCASSKGSRVYVLDGDNGSVVATFSTERSVVGDIALVDVNQDGKVDLAYVADTGGNIYRINFSDPSLSYKALEPAGWSITKVAYTSGASRKFLFAPSVVPIQNKVYVAVGSGDREHPTRYSYPYTTPVVNRFYVYLDDPTSSTLTNLDSLADRTTSAADTCSTQAVTPTGSLKGWYMSLNENGKGEQVVSGSLIQGGMVTFNTNRPASDTAACTTELGESRGYWVNLLNGSGAIGVSATCGGTRSQTFKSGGLPPSPVSAVVTINKVPQNVVIGAVQRDGTASSIVGGQNADPKINATRSRVYWRTNSDTR